MDGQDTGMTHRRLVSELFQSLAGTWKLNRLLQSTNAAEPSGKCVGEATFTLRTPSPVLNDDGNPDIASSELLYHEQGEFELSASPFVGQNSPPKFSFSRKYIWRLQSSEDFSKISIWFAKPGTDVIDYLFHKINIAIPQSVSVSSASGKVIHGSGGHLCIDDMYNTSYSFILSNNATVLSWTSNHKVQGPKKDQIIETSFTRP